MDTFPAWLRSEGYAPRTVTIYTQTIRRAERYLDAIGSSLATATVDDLRSFWLSVPESRESRKGVRCALLAWYRYKGLPGGGIARDLPTLPAPHRTPRPHSIEEFMRFIAAARDLGGRHHVIGEMLAYTGARISEIRCATWEQFSLSDANPVWYVTGKGSGRRGPRVRQVSITPRLTETLRTWRPRLAATGPLFPGTSADGCICYSTARLAVADIAEEAGIDTTTPHRWRHTFATLALEQTGDLRGLQEQLGHASLTSTQIYTGVVPSRLASLVRALPGAA